MDSIKEWLIAFVAREDNPLGLGVLAGSALLEYLFPPFPGDTITLFAAVLITAYGWSFAGVYGAVLAGSLVGSMVVYWVGVRLEARRRHDRRPMVDKLVARFKRHGAAYLVLNRFLPGFRAVFFVAAGMAGLRAGQVALYSALSAGLWNLLVIGAGSALGANLPELQLWLTRYMAAVWIAVAVVASVMLVRALLRRRGVTPRR